MNYRIYKIQETEQDFNNLAELMVNFTNEHQLGVLSAKDWNPAKVIAWGVTNIKCGAWAAIEEETGKWVASIGLHETTTWYGDKPYLTDGWFYVLPAYRQNKVGSDLLDAAKKFAEERSQPLMVGILNMEDVDFKIKMMQRKGFAIVGGLFLAGG
jgi:GNAT superfamily N-acetyltransferase